MRSPQVACVAFYLLFATTLAGVVKAESANDKAVQKVVKNLINSIRYKKDDLAAKQLAFEAMSKELLGDAWPSLPASEQKEFTGHLETLLRKISFVKGREMFQYLDAVLYEPVSLQGEQAHCKSTVVIHRDLKKTELPIEWVLVKEGGQWKVLDTVTMGESTATGIRQEQVQPLLKEGGTTALMTALRKKVTEVSKS